MNTSDLSNSKYAGLSTAVINLNVFLDIPAEIRNKLPESLISELYKNIDSKIPILTSISKSYLDKLDLISVPSINKSHYDDHVFSSDDIHLSYGVYQNVLLEIYSSKKTYDEYCMAVIESIVENSFNSFLIGISELEVSEYFNKTNLFDIVYEYHITTPLFKEIESRISALSSEVIVDINWHLGYISNNLLKK
jgi:hypothetical protein